MSDRRWKWLDNLIKKAKKAWFVAAQERASDAKHAANLSRFVEALHRAHQKRADITEESAIRYGKAFKRALDIGKHGGRVELPQALRAEIARATKGACDKFLTDV